MGDVVLLALLLSFLAGISTTIGAVVAFFIKKPTHRILGLTLGFSLSSLEEEFDWFEKYKPTF